MYARSSRHSAPLLALTMLLSACTDELAGEDELDEDVSRSYAEYKTGLTIEGVESPYAGPSPSPGGYLCPECAQLLGWTSSTLDVFIRLRGGHTYDLLEIGLAQQPMAPVRIPVKRGLEVRARYRLSSQIGIVPIPELEVVAYDYDVAADGEASEVEIEVVAVDENLLE